MNLSSWTGVRPLAVLFAALLLGMPVSAAAQLTTGALRGTVLDQSGAVVPGATVTATSLANGRVRSTVTSAVGDFRMELIEPGVYAVRAELTGFNPQEFAEIRVEQGGVATLTFELSVAGATETVEVVAEAPLVDLNQTQLRTQIDSEVLDEIPISGRRFQDFSTLAPGVHIDWGSTQAGGTDAISFFGFNERFKSIYVDGVDLNDELTGGGTGITDAPRAQFSMEAIEEINILRNQFTAEVGRQQAGVINIVTRSGTNELRARVFGFMRDDSLDAKNHFATGEIPFRQLQFGANVGGPIVRNETHFFVNFERWDAEQVATIAIPPGLADFLPDPRTEIPATDARNNFFLKLTHSLSDSHLFNLSYLHDQQARTGQAASADAAADARFDEDQQDDVLVTRLTSTLGQRTVNELRASYSRSFTDRPSKFGTAGQQFPGIYTGTPTNMPQGRTQTNWIVSDTFTTGFTAGGEHSLKIGGEVNVLRVPTGLNLFQFGRFTFTQDAPPGPMNPPVLWLGARYAFDTGDLFSNFYGVFIHDDWRVNDRLTLNLGLRYDYEDYNRGSYEGADYPALSTYEDRVNFVISARPGGENAGTLYKLRENDANEWQPRFGFNWAATEDGRTSLRGGYGIFYEGGHDPISVAGVLRPNRAQLYVAPGGAFDLLSFYPDQPPDALLDTFFPSSFVSADPGVFIESAFAHQFTVGLDRELSPDLALSLDYAALRSRQNPRDVNVNHPDASGNCPFIANCSPLVLNLSDGRLNSDVLQAQLRGRLGSRGRILASYTWLDARGDGPSTSPDLRDADFGPTPNDVRHHVVVSGSATLFADVELGGVLNYGSAYPYNQVAGSDTTGDGNTANNRSAGVTYNSLRGDGYFTLDLRLSRTFGLGGDRSLQLIVEAFNITNAVNFNRYNGNEQSALFKQATQALNPFQAQLGVRLDF